MKLNYKRTILVGFAFFLISLFWQNYDATIPVILTNKFGIPQDWSGFIMALDNILAVFMLPIFGALSDKCRSKHGKRTPFITVGTILAAVLLIALSFTDKAQLDNISDVATIDDPAGMHILYDTQKDKELKTPDGDKFVLAEIFTEEEFVAIPSKVKVVKMSDPLRILRKNDMALAYKEGDTLNLKDLLTAEGIASIKKDGDREVVQKICDKGWTITVLDGKGYVCAADLSEAEQADLETKQISHPDYINYVSPARQAYAADTTASNPLPLILFIVLLLAVLIAMAIFRSPAVALMPDVTVKPLRSKGNAVINLMGTAGGILVLGLGMVFSTSQEMMRYTPYYCLIAGIMLVALIIFLATVREPKWAKEMEEDSVRYGIVESAEGNSQKRTLSKGEKRSLIFILLSVALWYIGYNAVTSKYSVYAPNILDMDYNTTMLIAQGFAIAAYFPAGIVASKIGRKKTILAGVVMLAAAFGAAAFARASTPTLVMNIMFALAGIGWATINVNSFPMVVELCSGGDTGKYTGYYYTASMSAQVVTPILSGILMRRIAYTTLFPYAAIFVALAFVTMLFVKHGDSKAEVKKGLEALDIDD